MSATRMITLNNAQMDVAKARQLGDEIASCASQLLAVSREHAFRMASLGVAPAVRDPAEPDMPAAATGAWQPRKTAVALRF